MERFLENKVCIITGAAQGIGKSIADRFAGDGAIVYACDRQEGSMDVWAEQCAAAQGTRVIPLYFDVTDIAAVKSVLCRYSNERDALMCWLIMPVWCLIRKSA